ncbi:unnamed protein product, partial [Polarella glacialis]
PSLALVARLLVLSVTSAPELLNVDSQAAMAATRESVLKNALVQAKETAKRHAEHKDLINKFVRSFESQGSEDLKYGKRKYKALLQKAVNDKLGTIFIDLNDVEEFCKKEILDPDSQISASLSVSKIQLQQSIDYLIGDIENNAYRYQRYFYE